MEPFTLAPTQWLPTSVWISTGIMAPMLTSVKRPKKHETHSSQGIVVKGVDEDSWKRKRISTMPSRWVVVLQDSTLAPISEMTRVTSGATANWTPSCSPIQKQVHAVEGLDVDLHLVGGRRGRPLPFHLDDALGPKKHETHSSQGIVVKGVDDVLVRLSRCCNPVPGDDILKAPARACASRARACRGPSACRRSACNTTTHRDGMVEMRFLFQLSDLAVIETMYTLLASTPMIIYSTSTHNPLISYKSVAISQPFLLDLTRGRGVSVHRADCPNALDLKRHPERIIEVEWEGTPTAAILDIDAQSADLIQIRRHFSTFLA